MIIEFDQHRGFIKKDSQFCHWGILAMKTYLPFSIPLSRAIAIWFIYAQLVCTTGGVELWKITDKHLGVKLWTSPLRYLRHSRFVSADFSKLQKASDECHEKSHFYPISTSNILLCLGQQIIYVKTAYLERHVLLQSVLSPLRSAVAKSL